MGVDEGAASTTPNIALHLWETTTKTIDLKPHVRRNKRLFSRLCDKGLWDKIPHELLVHIFLESNVSPS